MTKRSKAETKAVGWEISRLRTQKKGWSRSKLLTELHKKLLSLDYAGEPPNQQWLERLENGELVVLQRLLFNVLCDVLECNTEERAKLHLLADRNVVVVVPGITTALAEQFNYLMLDLYDDVCAIVESQTAKPPIRKLTQADVTELFYAAIELVIADRRSRNR